jgi:hypothetical protein
VGQCRERKIHQGRSPNRDDSSHRPFESNRFVTGVTWIDGELWHGTWEGDESDLRRVDLERERREARDAAWGRRVGARVRWRRSVLLRRRKQREGENRPPNPGEAPRPAAAPRSPSTPRASNRSGPPGRGSIPRCASAHGEIISPMLHRRRPARNPVLLTSPEPTAHPRAGRRNAPDREPAESGHDGSLPRPHGRAFLRGDESCVNASRARR